MAPGMFLAHKRRAFERIDGDVDLGAGLGADLLADEQHRRLVHLALPDHDGAVDRQLVELAPHGVDRGLIGGLFVAAPAQPRRRDRRALGHAHDLDRENALQHRDLRGTVIDAILLLPLQVRTQSAAAA